MIASLRSGWRWRGTGLLSSPVERRYPPAVGGTLSLVAALVVVFVLAIDRSQALEVSFLGVLSVVVGGLRRRAEKREDE